MILACDTSSAVCSVAVADARQLAFKQEDRGAQIHIEKLAPFLKAALNDIHRQDIALEALAIAIGPGSFNGLRIGLATMKALAYALSLPLIPIPTTDAMAQACQRSHTGKARAIIFSHRDLVHYADYNLQPGVPIVTPEFHYGPWTELADPEIDLYFGLADRGFETWLHHAPEAAAIRKRFQEIPADAGEVALLAAARGSGQAVSLDELEPFYNARYEAKKWVPPVF